MKTVSKEITKEALKNVLNKFFNTLRESIVELSHCDKPTWAECPPEHVGCGVAVKYMGKYFVLTAAHVIAPYANRASRNPYKSVEEYDTPEEAFLSLDNIGFYLNDSFYTLERVFFDKNPAGIIDIGVIFIPENIVEKWGDEVNFLEVEDFLIQGETDTHPNYYICGYPNCWVDLDEANKKIVRRPFQYVTSGVIPDKECNLRYNPKYNILLSYDKTKMTGEIHEGELLDFYPQGISGCGLWHRSSNGEFKLAGIMIEDKTMVENATYMMATKIDVALMMLNDAVERLTNSSNK